MLTPLYKSLKQNGTTFYAFPGTGEDFSAMQMNPNYKMYFTKYVLLNFPKQDITGTQSKPLLDFYDTFKMSPNATPALNFSDQIVESLRNYVANQEVTIKESKINNTEYYYDNRLVTTPTENIFWKWAKHLNLIDYEPAIPDDEYFNTLPEFESKNVTDDTYLPEILWKEREVIKWQTYTYELQNPSLNVYDLYIEFMGVTNFKTGDRVLIDNISDTGISTSIGATGGIYANVKEVLPMGPTATGQSIVFTLLNDPIVPSFSVTTETTSRVSLVYNRFVQYIGEINGVNNVQNASKAYTEVHAMIPDHTGRTPDILFRTRSDKNYKPNMIFPILPSQYQPEIMGAEVFTNPIVSTPQNYPGSYYGQFDTDDFTYTTSGGDSLRRTGDYFGVYGDKNTPVYNSDNIDGVYIDFDTNHYVKMNIAGQELTNFDQFNALMVNEQPPQDFEFNAILWYYQVEDINGNSSTNLYGISFLDHPNNNPKESETHLRFPPYKKFANNDYQDGTAYSYSINLNYNINKENVQEVYNPDSVNSLFSMSLFNQAMAGIVELNDSYSTVISEFPLLQQQINDLKGLIYTQQDINVLSNKITYLESLLKLYSSMQIISSDTIEVAVNSTNTPPLLQLNSKDSTYNRIDQVLTTNLYNSGGVLPMNLSIPDNKNFLLNVINNDETYFDIGTNNLVIMLDRDLDYKQSIDIIVDSTTTATENKKLDIYIKYKQGSDTDTTISNVPVETPLITGINLPIYYNKSTLTNNSAKNWKSWKFEIDLTKSITLNASSIIEIPLNARPDIVYNSVKEGDTIELMDFIIGTTSAVDYSNQYTISSVGSTNSYIYLDASKDTNLLQSVNSLPALINGTASSQLSAIPYIKLNKGVKYKITRVDQSEDSTITDRYLIEKEIR